jgi:hypothetical protein
MGIKKEERAGKGQPTLSSEEYTGREHPVYPENSVIQAHFCFLTKNIYRIKYIPVLLISYITYIYYKLVI